MKEDVFKIGYSTYLQRQKVKQEKWTSKILNKLSEHSIITSIVFIIVVCFTMNLYLIFSFIRILEEIR